MFCLEISSENQKLQQNQKKTEKNCKFSQGKGEFKAQNIRDRRNRRGSEAGFCDHADAKRVYKQPDQKDGIALSFTHGYSCAPLIFVLSFMKYFMNCSLSFSEKPSNACSSNFANACVVF